MVTPMFRELPSKCVSSIEESGSFSLRLAVLATETGLFVNFWLVTSLPSLCIAVIAGRVCNPTTLNNPTSSFVALLDRSVHLMFVSGFAQRFVWTISRVLPQHKTICVVPKHDADDIQRALILPSVEVLELPQCPRFPDDATSIGLRELFAIDTSRIPKGITFYLLKFCFVLFPR